MNLGGGLAVKAARNFFVHLMNTWLVEILSIDYIYIFIYLYIYIYIYLYVYTQLLYRLQGNFKILNSRYCGNCSTPKPYLRAYPFHISPKKTLDLVAWTWSPRNPMEHRTRLGWSHGRSRVSCRFPLKNGEFPMSFVSLPEGKGMLVLFEWFECSFECSFYIFNSTGWWWLEHDWIIFPFVGNVIIPSFHSTWLSHFSEGRSTTNQESDSNVFYQQVPSIASPLAAAKWHSLIGMCENPPRNIWEAYYGSKYVNGLQMYWTSTKYLYGPHVMSISIP